MLFRSGKTDVCTAPRNQENLEAGTRTINFAKEIYIEREDFREDADKKFFRLRPGGEVRLKYSYIIKCEEIIKDAEGNIVELHCTYDPSTKPGVGEWRKVKGTIHWLSVADAKKVEVRLYDRLFTEENMGGIPEGLDYKSYLNPKSLVVKEAFVEPALLEDDAKLTVQFERNGYFVKDEDSTADHFVFNKTTGLKSSY